MLRFVSRLIVHTSRRMTSTYARLANRFFCTGISHDTYGCVVWFERIDVEKKKRKKKRKENTCTRANEFWHSFYTATRYDMSRDHREKNACPLENACLLTTTFYPSCNNWVDLYYTNLNSENEIDSKSIIQIFSTDYSDEITRIERTFLFFYPTRNKIIRYYYISYVYIYINFYQIF